MLMVNLIKEIIFPFLCEFIRVEIEASSSEVAIFYFRKFTILKREAVY